MTENVMETLKGCPFLKNLCSKKVAANYEVPSRMKEEIDKLLRISTKPHLTDEEVDDLIFQMEEMAERGIVHYIMHTSGRGSPSPYDRDTGDRYWEVGYLDRAHTLDFFSGFSGNSIDDFKKKGMQYLVVETRMEEYDAGEPKGDIPDKMAHQLELMGAAFSPSLSKMDIADLRYQIQMMRGKGISNYIIHTCGRNYFPQTESYTGDRYWECKDTTIGTGLYGAARKDFIDEGMESLFYENLI